MNTGPNKISRRAGLALICGLAVCRLAAAEVSDILTPPIRQEALDQGKRLLAQREAPTIAVDPFHPDAFAEAAAATPHQPGTGAQADAGPRPGPRSEHELLELIAAGLKPSGNFVINGQQTLLFGQKRVKAGGFLTITFEGNEYTLEVTAIQRTNFTLRLNREEFTRPIK
jgi:hypothetical protein